MRIRELISSRGRSTVVDDTKLSEDEKHILSETILGIAEGFELRESMELLTANEAADIIRQTLADIVLEC